MTEPTSADLDLPTPEQVAAYLEACGFHHMGARMSGQHESWCRDLTTLHVPKRTWWDARRVSAMLVELAGIEGRPSPAKQVRRDMVQVDAPKLDDDPCGCCGHARAVHDNSGSCRATDDREGDRCCFCPSFARPWGGTR